VEHFLSLGITPIVLTTPQIRKDFKKLSVQLDPDITVLSYNEIEQHVEIYSDKVVKI
jgi:flagellar biosynthesis protein FlhA